MKPSKFTLSFAGIGFVLALISVAGSIAYANTDDPATIKALTVGDLEFMLCPPSLMYMSFEGSDGPSWFSYIVIYGSVITVNTVWYGLLGMGISKLWASFKRPSSS
jgi:hypothetical protein